MSNLAPQSDVLNLTPKTSTTQTSKVKESKVSKESEASKENQTQSDTEDFLNSLLNSIDETNEFLPDRMKITEKEVLSEAMSKLQNQNFDESDKMSIFESASFMQILSLLDKLKADTSDIKLSNLSTQLTQLVKTEANFNKLKSASNLNELLNIAKDLGLEVKNIKIDRLLELKTTFPNLNKANFFKGAVDSVFKEIVNNKIAHISKDLNKNLEKTELKNKNEISLLSQTLKNLDSLKNKENKDEKTKLKTEAKNEISNKLENENLSENLKTDFKNLKNESLKESENLKTEKNEKTQISNETTKETKNTKISKNDKNQAQTQENFKEKLENVKNESIKNESVKSENFDKNINKESLKETQILSSNLNQKENLSKEKPKENFKENKLNINEQKIYFENLNKTQFVQSKENSSSNLENFKENNKEVNLEQKNSESKTETNELNSLVKDLSKISSNNAKNITPKETLQYFSEDLKEALNQYKAPITKLSITLNPNNLGEVEVTLMQRGNNLHINFNSNTNAMNLFLQNQAEFKNSLVNMGFTGLEMNFSDQKREQNQNQNKNKSTYGFKDILEGNDSEKVNLELVLAKYF